MVIFCSYWHLGKIKFQFCFQEKMGQEFFHGGDRLRGHSLLREQEEHIPACVCESPERNGHQLFSCVRLVSRSHDGSYLHAAATP